MKANTLSDIELARFNMVEQQVRPWGVGDEAVLQALFDVPRERYVPAAYRGMAFSDTDLPLITPTAHTCETMLAPRLEARLAQELQLQPGDSVLEIGTGSGHQAALLARLARQVISVEIDSRLAAFAIDNLQRNQVDNVTVEIGDAHDGWGTTEYDAILVTGSVPVLPDALKYQLRVGGRLVVVIGQAPIMTAWRYTRESAAAFRQEPLFDTLIKPLRGATVPKFRF